MKTKILFIVAFLIAFAANAQQKRIKAAKVPQIVQDAFKIKYPDARVKRWMKENDSYAAECKGGRIKYTSTFNADGKWISTTKIIRWKEAPEVVRAAFNQSKYRTWQINDIKQIDASDGTTSYLVIANNENEYPDADHASVFKETHEIYISAKGEIIKTHKKC